MKKNANTSDDHPTDAWEACPPGTLAAMADRLNAAGRRSEALRVLGAGGVGALLVAAVVVTAGMLTGNSATSKYGGISCQQCQPHFADYYEQRIAGDAARPDAGRREGGVSLASVARHLADCPVCRAKFAQQYPHALGVETRLPPSNSPFSSPSLAISTGYLPGLAVVAVD